MVRGEEEMKRTLMFLILDNETMSGSLILISGGGAILPPKKEPISHSHLCQFISDYTDHTAPVHGSGLISIRDGPREQARGMLGREWG